jgi:hypothetical protein
VAASATTARRRQCASAEARGATLFHRSQCHCLPSLTRLGSIQYNSGAFAHFGEHVDDSLTVPLVTVMRASDDSGFTLLLSPDDLTPELLLRIDGSQVILARLFQRLKPGATPPLAFTMLIRAHAADWRPALKFWVDSFPG